MNTNPHAKRILCFGDSITYGRVPKGARYSVIERFTGILQNILGNDYEIIEEGLRGRTLYGDNKSFPGREGNLQFGPILGSHLPLDLVIIMLGTNDSNHQHPLQKEEDIHTHIDHYMNSITWRCESIGTSTLPKVLLISPPHIRSDYGGELFKEAFNKLEIIQKGIESYAEQNNIALIRSYDHIQASEIDGVHLDTENNKILGTILAKTIKEII